MQVTQFMFLIFLEGSVVEESEAVAAGELFLANVCKLSPLFKKLLSQ